MFSGSMGRIGEPRYTFDRLLTAPDSSATAEMGHLKKQVVTVVLHMQDARYKALRPDEASQTADHARARH